MAKTTMRELAESFVSQGTSEVADVVTFIESNWGLNLTLKPTQRFVIKAFYGLELDDTKKTISIPDVVNDRILYEFTEVEFLDWLYEEGRCNTKEMGGKNFRELVLVMGRRSGKSTMASCLALYELYKLVKLGDPNRYYGFAPGNVIAVTNVASSDDQANVVLDMSIARMRNCLYLRDRAVNQTQSYFNLLTDSDIKSNEGRKKRASLVAVSGGCASNSLRGRSNIVVILDELAHFIDNGGRFSGREVYRALVPSTATFRGDGKVVCISSPHAKYGIFYERYLQSFDEPDTTLMFKMHAAMVNPDVDSVLLKTERRRDRSGFMSEYGGEFSDTVRAWIDDEASFRDCISTRKGRARGEIGVTYFMGVDLGLKNDGTSVVIVHRDDKTKRIVLDYADVWYSASSDVWEHDNSIYKTCRKFANRDIIRVAEVAQEIQRLCKWFPIKGGWFDQYNGYSLYEQLYNMGLKQFHMEQINDALTNKVFQLLKMLLMDKMVDMFDHPILVPEILSLEAEEKSKNKVIVRAPNKSGAHDDLSDAFARAVWEVYSYYKDRPMQNITSLVVGGRVIRDSSEASQISLSSFQMMKRKKHGANSRVISSKSRHMANIGRR